MNLFRTLARGHASLAAFLVVLSLAARAAMPMGYMPDVRSDDSIAVAPCSGVAAQPAAPLPPAAMAGMADVAGMSHLAGSREDHHGPHEHHRPDQPCAYGALSGSPLLASTPPKAVALA